MSQEVALLVGGIVVVLLCCVLLVVARRRRDALTTGRRDEGAGAVRDENPTFFSRLRKTRHALEGYLLSIRSRKMLDDATWQELETALLRADVGVAVTNELLLTLRTRAQQKGITNGEMLIEELKLILHERTSTTDRTLHASSAEDKPVTWLFVGVNGVGKTTTIGKVALRYAKAHKSVIVAAGDTFRAAAVEQLQAWAERAEVAIVRGQEGGDPSAVLFDALSRAEAKHADLVLADTAGRLHNKFNLMEELKKIKRIAERPGCELGEVLLVIDATTGQNGLQQAKVFTEAVQCTGVVLTKLDGSAKGGVALAIELEMGLPIKLVGLGEANTDLIDFDAHAFVDSLFEEKDAAVAARRAS